MQVQTKRHDHHQQQFQRSRVAFSLVELMIVLIIIAILMAFLFPAIGGAIITARNATVVSEVSNLEKAIGEFKLKYGVEPPSRIWLYEQADGWDASTNTGDASDIRFRESKAVLKQIWPNIDFTYSAVTGNEIDIDGNDAIGSTNYGRIELRGAECLLFFLGGVCATEDGAGATLRGASGTTPPSGTATTVAKWFPLGFSTNPSTPFIRGGNRVGPFFEFESERILNIPGSATNRSMPEYLDTLPGQIAPYNYASSYDGRGYNTSTDAGGYIQSYTDLNLGSSSVVSPTFVYIETKTQDTADDDGDSNTSEYKADSIPFNKSSFQIISPGIDQQFGTGGYYNSEEGFSGFADDVQKDNIANFRGAVLDPS